MLIAFYSCSTINNSYMESTKIFLAGEFIETSKTLKVYYPYNGDLFATTYRAGEAQLEEAIIAAQAAREELRKMPVFARSEALWHIRQRLMEMKETFAQTITAESGKPVRNARVEVDRSIGIFTVAAEEVKRLPKEYLSLDWTPSGEGREALVKYFPVGIVAGISPYNFPLNLAVHKIAPAIAAGCPIILKPSSATPLSTLLLSTLIAETDLPKGAVSVLPMDRETGNLLVTDQRISMLSFTGSPEVGWKMKEQSGKKKVVLELGGNAGVIVSDDCNLDFAIAKCINSGFSYSGQTCIHAQRLFVQEKVYDEFVRRYTEGVKKLVVGDPMGNDTDMSVMIDEDNAARVEQWVTEALLDGAELVTGGKRTKNLYQPTVIKNTNSTMKICSHEVFGPVVTIDPYSSFDDAVKMMNDTRFGLQAGVFTNRIDEMNKAFNELEVGGVILNDGPTFRADHMPYGGIKDSGFGREGVKYAIMDMLEARVLVKPV
jgi:acyl-CoA reductase-like NAD-dependent aldehyde dehydrogenase